MISSLAAARALPNRSLGAAGILGGVVLLAAFVVAIPGDLNTLRLVLFDLGALAVVSAVQRRPAATGSRPVLVVASAAVLARWQ